MPKRHFYVYMMSNQARTLYVGVTNDLAGRVQQHKDGTGSKFTSRYALTNLVYFEETSDVRAAIAREKQLKSWLRSRKVALVLSVNPEWDDLSAAWSSGTDPSLRSG
jgi:putative endonuclease